MKNKLAKILAIIPAIAMLGGCGDDEEEPAKEPAQKVTKVADYIYDVETYTSLDYDYADQYWAENNDNWGGCSAITKKINIKGDEHRIIGRNMDLNISNNCAYFVRTKVPGKYETMGLQYTFRNVSPTYAEVEANGGISAKWSKLLPFMCDDVMNTEGFHIEVNMRHGESYPNGDDMFAIKSTNPNGTRRVHMFELPQYIAERCATVAEAKEFIKTLDIYSKKGYWNYCFIMADKTGAASLLEFSKDDLYFESPGIYWIDEEDVETNPGKYSYLDKADYYGSLNYHKIAQTNFFINELAFLKQDIKSGFGRMQTMQNGIDEVTSRSKMFDLMNKVAYSNFYKPYAECKANNFDPRSEQVGEHADIPLISALIMNDEYEEDIIPLMDAYTEPIRSLTREEKRNANQYWESTFTEVVDCNDMSIQVRVFEDESLMFKLTFDGLTRITAIE